MNNVSQRVLSGVLDLSRDRVSRRSARLACLIFAIGMLLSPVGDLLNIRGASGNLDNGGRYSLLVRGLTVAGLIVAMLLNGRLRASNWRVALLAVIGIGAAGVNLALGGMSGEEFAAQTVFILKVFSFFVYLAALSRLNGRQLAFLERFVVAALFVYAAAIIAGALFSIEAFRSYQDDTQIRSGYKGIVYAQNEASALMVAGLAYVYSRVLRFGWRPLEGVLVFCVFCASLLVGTKAAAVGACAVFVVYCYARHSVMGATVRAGIAIALIAGVAVTAYLTLPSIADAVDLSIRYFLYQYDNMRSENGLLSIVLSGRDLKFEQIAGEIARLDYLPLLTGGFPVVRYLVEIDVPDLALCLGVPVFVFYLRALKRGFVVARSGRVARFGTLFFVVLLLIACTAGHALNSAVVSPFLAVLATIVQRGEEPRTQGE